MKGQFLIRVAMTVLVPLSLVSGLAAQGAVASQNGAGQQSAGRGAAPAVPYGTGYGQQIVAQAERLVAGQPPWTKGCQPGSGGKDCIPYSHGAGHGAQPGPSYGTCKSGLKMKRCVASDTFGLDCSGFTRWVFALVYGSDVLGSKNTTSQKTRPGVKQVAAGGKEPGDLVFFPGHVGIYTGMIHGHAMMANEPHTGAYAKVESFNQASASYYRYVNPQIGTAFAGVVKMTGSSGNFGVQEIKENKDGYFTGVSAWDLEPVTGTIDSSGTVSFSIEDSASGTVDYVIFTGTAVISEKLVMTMMSGTYYFKSDPGTVGHWHAVPGVCGTGCGQ